MKKLNCVLLVEDNVSDNFLHKRVLEKAGIAQTIEITENGQEALEYLRSLHAQEMSGNPVPHPDLILLDINMPVMDGWEFLEEYETLCRQNSGKKAAVIILTTSLNPTDRVKAEETLGTDHFKFKPLTTEMLKEIVHKHFPDHL
jgi:CheY-like chemotaxis protein